VSALLAVTLLSGCGYRLQGKVVRGQMSSIEVVHQLDERLQAPGLSNVETVVRRDPHRPGSPLVARQYTGPTGDFSMNIGDFGAGWMHEEWLFQARAPGHQNASAVMKLPPQGRQWRLLITLAPGVPTPLDVQEEILEDLERFR
jgi:hypothetical protein